METDEAARMLLAGATLAAQPCPYCGGVRVIKDGDAFCTGCGSGPAEGPARGGGPAGGRAGGGGAAAALEKSIAELAAKAAAEPDGAKRSEIASAVESLSAALEKLRKTG